VEGAFRDLVAGEWAASFRAQGFEPGRLLPEGHALADLRGALTGAGEVDGTFEGVREARASGKLAGLAWRFVTPADWTWDASWEEGALGVRAEDTRGLRAEATWTAQEGVRAVLDAEKVALGSLMASPRVPEDASGEATGRLEVRLPPGGKVSATARFPTLRLSLPPVVLENREEIRLSYDAERLGVESLSLGDDQLEITVTGGGGVDGGWDLQATATGDLAAARQWSRHVRRASGKHRVDLEVRGSWERPRVSGYWEVTSGATLFVEGFGQPIEDLDAAIVLDPDQGIRVRWIDAQVGAGRVHVEGGVGLDGFRPSKLRLSAELRDIRYEWPPKVSYGLDADLLVTGTAGKPELRGEIRLEEFLYARRLNLKTLTLELLKPRARAVAGMPMEGQSVFVDLAVRGVGDLRVENNFADVRLGVDLRARGHLPKPVLWGRVEVLEGTVRARGVEYEMRRSAVEFLGETRPVPLLDVHATTAVQQYDISVDVTGPLDGYQVLLSSLPPLAENDIVALLSVGATTSELPDADALAAVQAASYATGGLQDNLEEGVGEFLGIDQLSVDPSYSSAAQTTMTRITVGKAITRSLFARYSAAVGGTAEQDVEVQYNLAPRVSLLGTWTDRPATAQAGERGSLGGEIRFRFPFR
jgi:translocation and assembly module TamB